MAFQHIKYKAISLALILQITIYQAMNEVKQAITTAIFKSYYLIGWSIIYNTISTVRNITEQN